MEKPSETEWGQLLWRWANGGISLVGGRRAWRDRHEARFPLPWYDDPECSPIPGFATTVERIGKAGFIYVRASSSFVFSKFVTRGDSSTVYGVFGWLHFAREDLMFRQRVASPPSSDAAGALNGIRFEQDGVTLISSILVEGGQGQLERARRHAADMLRRAGDAHLFLDACEVECRSNTRQDGWQAKTQIKRFAVSEISLMHRGRA